MEDSKVLAERLRESIAQISTVSFIGTTDSETVAVAVALNDEVDVIVLDLHLKQGTGFGVMRALASVARKPQIIVLTNYDLPEYKKAAISLGATYFFDKARDFGKLSDVLVQICDARRNAH